MDQTLPFVLLVAFLATFARSAVGFGDALIAMPLLTILLGIQTATPLVGLMAAAMSGMILLQSWREVEVGDAWRLVLSSFNCSTQLSLDLLCSCWYDLYRTKPLHG